MTGADWVASGDVIELLAALPVPVDRRKERLFAVACCRRVWHLLTEPASQLAVEQAERYVEGGLRRRELVAARQAAHRLVRDSGSTPAEFMASAVARPALTPGWVAHLARNAEQGVPEGAKRAEQAGLLRDIYGPNPFRPVTFAPAWRTDTVLALARQMYESRDFSAMPILADALQDAGCDNEDLLSHCRDPHQVHVRGCWVVDGVLGKT